VAQNHVVVWEMMKTCDNCAFHHDRECRAHPPTVQIDDECDPVGVFPPVLPTWWCGEWVDAE
jgi:hypothetical protein